MRLHSLIVFYRYSCAIPEGEELIITGGSSTGSLVSVYSEKGLQSILPYLITGRWSHACSSYMFDGVKVIHKILKYFDKNVSNIDNRGFST